jgi:hypothetical protein
MRVYPEIKLDTFISKWLKSVTRIIDKHGADSDLLIEYILELDLLNETLKDELRNIILVEPSQYTRAHLLLRRALYLRRLGAEFRLSPEMQEHAAITFEILDFHIWINDFKKDNVNFYIDFNFYIKYIRSFVKNYIPENNKLKYFAWLNLRARDLQEEEEMDEDVFILINNLVYEFQYTSKFKFNNLKSHVSVLDKKSKDHKISIGTKFNSRQLQNFLKDIFIEDWDEYFDCDIPTFIIQISMKLADEHIVKPIRWKEDLPKLLILLNFLNEKQIIDISSRGSNTYLASILEDGRYFCDYHGKAFKNVAKRQYQSKSSHSEFKRDLKRNFNLNFL